VSTANEVALPKEIHAGIYRLYELPDGGLHLVYKPTGEDERHMELPAAIMLLAKSASEGEMSPHAMMGEMMKLMMSGGLSFGNLCQHGFARPTYRGSRHARSEPR
jgi:hypothetical protein